MRSPTSLRRTLSYGVLAWLSLPAAAWPQPAAEPPPPTAAGSAEATATTLDAAASEGATSAQEAAAPKDPPATWKGAATSKAEAAKDPAAKAVEATAPKKEEEEESRRRLAGHDFLLTEFYPSPFATTHFGTVTGVGLARFTSPDLSLSLAALALSFNLQIALADFIALRGSVDGSALAGVNEDAALYYGASGGYGASAGVTLGKTFGQLRLGATLDADYQKAYQFNIVSAIEQSIEQDTIDASTLLISSSTIAPTGGLHAALGLHPAIGLLARVQYSLSIERADGKTDSTSVLGAGPALSFDLKPLTSIPLGALASYSVQYPLTEDATPTHELLGSLLYTGRANLSVGAEALVNLATYPDDVELTTIEGLFRMRYYW